MPNLRYLSLELVYFLVKLLKEHMPVFQRKVVLKNQIDAEDTMSVLKNQLYSCKVIFMTVSNSDRFYLSILFIKLVFLLNVFWLLFMYLLFIYWKKNIYGKLCVT